MRHSVLPVVKNVLRKKSHCSGAAAYAKAARRYDFQSPTFHGNKGRVLAIKADGTHNEVPAESIAHDLEYVVPVTVGTPGVKLMIDFDTGSADFWVWSSDIKSGHSDALGHAVYDPKKSSTSEMVEGGTWKISYGDGSSASGYICLDELKIGGLKCSRQGVEVAEKLSSTFLTSEGSDGLLGLAFSHINTATPQQKTPVQNMMENDILEEGLFTVCLKHDTEGEGFYSFGEILPKEGGVEEKDIAYTPVDNSKGFWAFESPQAKIGDEVVELQGNQAIADTGTTLALVSEEVVTALYKQIPGAVVDHESGGYVYPVDAQVPDVQLAVGKNMYTIPGKNLGYGEPQNGMQFGGIQSRGNNGFDILGDVFLKSVYAVFDQKNVRIGFAQRLNTPASDTQ
ncbi:hypothetical protein O181_035828 [Austropuccinia psidii MF-1]|uniref:Peptidase A1 domain-containing protein n=1 Tax=Austropuccinia psidii MF-1 TaxID=1389203 RepID=A0A9Q3D677_9BASI|nr:hypothetical protein [Austropuccinia psidii MF-1]